MAKELAKKSKETAVDKPKPRRGFEEPSTQDELIIPRAQLLQALSEPVVEKPAQFHPGLIINSLTREIMPEVFVPIFKFTNWIRFNPRNSKDPNFDPNRGPGEIIWRSNDPYDQKVKTEGSFGPDGERPLATKFLNFLSYFPGINMPIIVSFANTSYKAGKQLLSLAQFSGLDMFARQYELKAKQETKDVGTYFIFEVASKGDAPEDTYKLAEKWWEEYHPKVGEIKVHEETATDTEEAGIEQRPF